MSSDVRKNIRQGSLRATADAIEQMFGADEDLDLDDEFGFDDELDELYGGDDDLAFELAMLEDDDEDDDDAFGAPPIGRAPMDGEPKPAFGRREMANRARAHFRGNGGSSESFRAGVMYGYMQSLTDAGVPEGAVSEFGKFRPFKGVKNLFSATAKGVLGSETATQTAQHLGQGLASGLVGEQGAAAATPLLTPASAAAVAPTPVTAAPMPATAVAHQLGHRMGSGLGVVRGAPSAGAPVEAVRQTLPPVYVADTMGFEADADLIEGRGRALHGARANLPVEDSFGATALAGFVNGQARRSARYAAKDAAKHGATLLAVSERVSGISPFVEDPGAEPVLFGDGRIWDSIYGELAALPCPSCAPLSERQAFAGMGRSCVVCDGYGAILSPASDVPQWSGGVQYGIIPLLIPLFTAGAQAAAPALKSGGEKWMAGKKQAKAADLADRQAAILARLKKKEEEAAAATAAQVASAPTTPAPAASPAPSPVPAEPMPSVVATSAPTITAETISGFFEDDDEDEDEDFGFAVLGDEVEGASIDILLEDEDEVSELEGDIDEAFGISENDFAALEDDDDDEDDEFGAEDASSERLVDKVRCVRALVPASYLREVQPRGVQ